MPCKLTLNGVEAEVWSEAPGLRKGSSLLGRGPWRQIQYRVDTWEDADLFIDGLFDRIIYTLGPGSVFSYPWPHPYPGNENLVALDAEAQAIGPPRPRDGVDLVSCDYAVITVLYGVPDYDVFGLDTWNSFPGPVGPFSHDQVRGYAAPYSLPPAALKQQAEPPDPNNPDAGGDVGDPIPESFPVMVPHQEYTRTLYGVPYFYDVVLKSLVGRINHATFFGHARGTLRFDDYDVDVERLSDGTRAQRYTMRFIWRPMDWNRIPEGPPIRWTLVDDGFGNKPYAYANFAPLATGVT
jgi:hypothetical protein